MRNALLLGLLLAGCSGRKPATLGVDPAACNEECAAGSVCDSLGRCRQICATDTQCGGCNRCDADSLCMVRSCDEQGDETVAPAADAPSTVIPVPPRDRMQSDAFRVAAGAQAWIGESASARFRISPRK